MLDHTTEDQDIQRVPSWLEPALVAGILLIASLVRVIALRSLPPGFRYDELVNATGVDQVLREGPTIYFTSGWGHEPLFQHVAALVWLLLGRSVVTFRLTAALLAILGVIAGWLLARRLFDRWVALLTAAALATAFVPLLFGRLALRVIVLPLFTALAAYALWRAIDPQGQEEGEGRPYLWFTLGGICLGLGLLTYPAARVLPLMLLAFLLYMAIFHRQTLRGRWPGLLLYFGLAALISAPMFLYLRANPDAEQRYQQLSGLFFSLEEGNIQPFISGIWQSLTMFIWRGDAEWYYNIAGRPFFPLPVAILFYLGLAIAVWRWRKPAYVLALLLLLGGLIPVMLSSTNPGFSRAINILPVVYIFPALALVTGVNWAAFRWARWRKLIYGLIAILVLLYFGTELYAYFGVWTQSLGARELHGPAILELAERIETQPDNQTIAISTPGVNYFDPWDRLQMELLLTGDRPIRWFNGSNSLIIPAVDGPVTYYIRDNTPLDDSWQPILHKNQDNHEINTAGSDLSSFSIDILEEPKRAIEQLLGATQAGEPVRFGELVTLRGRSTLDGNYTPGDTLYFQTVWQADQIAQEPFIVFVHLLNDEGEWFAGWDRLDVTPESWGIGDVFALNHELAIPADAPPGTYSVTAGWYSPVTGVRLLPGDGNDHILLGKVEIQN